MSKKYKRKMKQKRVSLLFFIAFLIIVFFSLLQSVFTIPKKIGKDLLFYVQNFFNSPFTEKEIKFSEEVIEMEYEELKKEISELKAMLELKNVLSDKKIIPANVSIRNIGFFYDTITINKGIKDGIKEGMAVIVKDGLIGKTTFVSNNTSDVQLLTSSSIGKISVKIKSRDSYAYGLLTSYNREKNIYLVEGVSETIDVTIGEEVTTTGYGDTFPSGIIIGKVKSITTDHFDLAKIIEVEPTANVHDFSVVAVLKREVN